MRYDFNKMDADSFELMVRSLNEKVFGVKCEQYGLGPDGQREFTFEGSVTDVSGILFEGKTIGQVKFKYPTTKEDDYIWLKEEIIGELKRFRKKEKEYIPNNYLFYTNIVLTPMKDIGVKDKINAFIRENNDVIPNFYIKGYDEVCALLDNNRDVATSYASHILPGDVLMKFLKESEYDYSMIVQKYLARELEENMYTRMEQAGSVTEKKISIEKVCVDIDVVDREENATIKFAQRILDLGNGILGYRKENWESAKGEINRLDRNENFILTGGPGRGKTTICQFIAQIYRASYLYKMNYGDSYSKIFTEEIKNNYPYEIVCRRIPFSITLREYAAWISRQGVDGDISVIQYMKARIRKITSEDLSIKMIRQMLAQLAWIFFFDGLDEVPESSNREEVLKQIKLFIETDLREVKCDCMIIATTRMQGYNNDFDETKYKHLEVVELSKVDCDSYILKLFEVMEEQTEKRDKYIEIMREALEDDTTSRLMKTPLQATIISILVKSGGKPPHERYSLFRQYYDIMVKREKQKGVMATLNDNTDWLEEIHLLIANRLQRESEKDGNPSAEISKFDMKEAIKQYIDIHKDEFYETKESLRQKEEIFFKIVTERICFLCENREGFYSFSIRTMQEYFAGTYLVKGISDEDAINNIKEIAYKSYWRNALLFAFGYIELEKRNLETEIGNLCYEMNGRDNLVVSEYTSDNICLFGSWLSVDILAEDIFKGKTQNKYIEIAAKAIELCGCINFNKFSLISGVQCSKLKYYVIENYQNKKEYQKKVLSLYMKLNENEKNDMNQVVDDLIQNCDEEDRLQSCIKLLNEGIGFSEELLKKCEEILADFIISKKVKMFLPYKVLTKLAKREYLVKNLKIKQFLFLQFMYNRNTDISLVQKNFGFDNFDLNEIYLWLGVDRFARKKLRVQIVESFEYNLSCCPPSQNCLIEFCESMKKLQLDFLVNLCEFYINPTFAQYQILIEMLNHEEVYLATKYRANLGCGLNNLSEKEFEEYWRKRAEGLALFECGNMKKLMMMETCYGLGYSVRCTDTAFDELIENGGYTIDQISELGEVFFKSYIFAACVQLESIDSIENISEKTADRLVKLLEEANKRKMYTYRLYIIVVVLMASRFRKKLLESIPNLDFANKMNNDENISHLILQAECRYLTNESVSEVISSVVRIVTSSFKENNYLQVLLLLFNQNLQISKCISDNDMKELQNISYSNDYNRLAVYLLKMCKSENENPKEQIENLLKLNVDKKMIYLILVNMLHFCQVKNSEKLWIILYFRLEKENFNGSENIQDRILNDMLEAQCDLILENI